MLSRRIKEIIQKVSRQDIISSSLLDTGDQRLKDSKGRTALAVFLRKQKKSADPKGVIRIVIRFLRHGFNLYEADDRGVSPFHLLLSRISNNLTEYDRQYLLFLKDLVQNLPPPKPDQFGIHPLRYIFKRVKKAYEGDGSFQALRGAVLLVCAFSPPLPSTDVVALVREAIQDQYHIFLDPLLAIVEYPTLSSSDMDNIVEAIVVDRARFEQDDQDDRFLAGVATRASQPGVRRAISLAIDSSDDRALACLFHLIRSKRTRSVLAEQRLGRIDNCTEIEMHVIDTILQTGIRLKTPMIVERLVEMDCLEIIKKLYDHGALPRRVILDTVHDLYPEITNRTMVFLKQMLERATLLETVATLPAPPATRSRTSLGDQLRIARPDVLRQISRMLL